MYRNSKNLIKVWKRHNNVFSTKSVEGDVELFKMLSKNFLRHKMRLYLFE
jgi:hypothetical protein